MNLSTYKSIACYPEYTAALQAALRATDEQYKRLKEALVATPCTCEYSAEFGVKIKICPRCQALNDAAMAKKEI